MKCDQRCFGSSSEYEIDGVSCDECAGKEEPRNLPEANVKPPLSDVLSDMGIEQVAADECQNIDADSSGIRDTYYDGFVAGAKWA